MMNVEEHSSRVSATLESNISCMVSPHSYLLLTFPLLLQIVNTLTGPKKKELKREEGK